MGSILVIGSMNMDLVVKTSRCPQKGETILGEYYRQIPGGKGANQALAAGKLGADVSFIGACGRDSYGDSLIKSLAAGDVNTNNVFRLEENTGIAAITVEKDGDNRIIVVQGANKELAPDRINKLEAEIKNSDIVLLQLEIPLETVGRAINLSKQSQTKVILDPAPAQKLPLELYKKIDYLLPNENELDLLLENKSLNRDEKAKKLLALGVKKIILTRGKNGVTLYTNNKVKQIEPPEVNVVDTTAAGDAFAGSLAYGLNKRWQEEEAIKFANLVASFSVTRLGAQSSLPNMKEIKKFKKEVNK